MWPIIVTAPLELPHVDFTSIEQWWSLINPQTCWKFWSFVTTLGNTLWHITPDQTAKTVAKFLRQGYISIFGALAKLLSDWGAIFESNIIRELWQLMGIWEVRTSSYHAQTNGKVEQTQQMLMCMIGKLSRDWKADWPKHLSKLVHAYNSTRLAITRYSLHYVMYRHQLCLPIDLYFPTIRGMKKHQHVDHYIAELHE